MKKIGLIAGGIVIVVFAGIFRIFIVLATLDVNQYKGLIEEQAAAATGRTLTIEGDMDLSVSLSPAIVINGVRFQNAEWGSRPDMAVIERVEASIPLIPALFGNISVTRLALVSPDILLERNAQGQANWEFGAEDAAEGVETESSSALAISAIELDDLVFAFKDAQAGTDLSAALERLRVNISGDLTAPDIDRLNLSGLKATADGTEIEVTSLTMSPVSGGTDIDLQAVLDGEEVTAKGEIGALSNIIAMNGAFPAKLDVSFGPFAFATDLMIDASGARPSLTGSITADEIDLTALPPAEEEPDSDKLFPSDPIPMDGLSAADVELDVSVGKLILQKKLALTNLKNKVTLKNGRLTNNQSADLGGGSMTSDVTLAAPAGTLTIKASGSGMQAQNIARDLEATDIITQGPLDFNVDLSGSGTSVAAMMGSLDGAIVGGMGEGRIRNDAINLAGADFLSQLLGAINPFMEQEEFTVAQCAVINLRVQDGVARTEKGIAFVSDRIEITSSGKIDFGQEKLDLNIRPKAKEGLGIGMGKLTQMVKVSGPLSSPGVGIDAAGAVRSLGSIAGAFATGGASLLAEGALERGQSADDACEAARTWHLAGN
jgi:uncharacterized protein involved in outer membrane biogenesis